MCKCKLCNISQPRPSSQLTTLISNPSTIFVAYFQRPKTMQTSSYHSPSLPTSPFSSNPKHNPRFIRQKRPSSAVFASKRDAYNHGYDGRMVDEDMIVLRKRIHEMEMTGSNHEPPREWMEWEKRYYTTYDSDICEAMGFLQSLLMDTRPSFALGMVVLVILSVPTSTAVVGFHLVEIVKDILARVNFG